MHWTARLSWLLCLSYWVWAWLTWTQAPDQVPLHFGLSGEPTRWGERSLVAWFGPPALATLLAAGLALLARRGAARPASLNLPGKARFADIPPEHRRPIGAAVEEIIGWAMLQTVVLLGLVQWAMIRGAAGDATQGVVGLVFALALLGSPILVWYTAARSGRGFDEAEARARGGPSTTRP